MTAITNITKLPAVALPYLGEAGASFARSCANRSRLRRSARRKPLRGLSRSAISPMTIAIMRGDTTAISQMVGGMRFSGAVRRFSLRSMVSFNEATKRAVIGVGLSRADSSACCQSEDCSALVRSIAAVSCDSPGTACEYTCLV